MTGVRMLLTYGATEYTQNVTQAPRDGDPKYGSAGLRLPYTQIRTVELDGNGAIKRECAIDEIGVVVVKGPSVTPGYLDPKYNAGIFTARRLVQFRRSRPLRRRRLSVAHRPRQGRHHPRRPQYRSRR